MEDTNLAEKHTVLLVEDDKFLRDIIESHLTKAGFGVLAATTGEEAFRIAHEKTPDLIILDIVLSGINGLDVIARLREEDGGKHIPFIVFTNSDEQSSVARGRELGAVKYMVKAISTPDKIVHEIVDFFANTAK
jgi:DNA-binding response OmpR family regulator